MFPWQKRALNGSRFTPDELSRSREQFHNNVISAYRSAADDVRKAAYSLAKEYKRTGRTSRRFESDFYNFEKERKYAKANLPANKWAELRDLDLAAMEVIRVLDRLEQNRSLPADKARIDIMARQNFW